MKVYAVESGSYSDYGIDGIFSTEEKAKAFIAKGGGEEILEWEVDELANHERKTLYQSCIYVLTGEVMELKSSSNLVDPNLRTPSWRSWNVQDVQRNLGYGELPATINRQSYVSQDHADKLCVESRQELLALANGYKLSPGRNAYWLKAEKIDV